MQRFWSVIRAVALLLGMGANAFAGLITYDFDIDFTEAKKGTLAGQFYTGSYTVDTTPEDADDEEEGEWDLDEDAFREFTVAETDLLVNSTKTTIDIEFEDGVLDFEDSEFKFKFASSFFLKELKFEGYEVTAKPHEGKKTEGFIRFRPRSVPDKGASTFLLITVFVGLAFFANRRKGKTANLLNETPNEICLIN